MAHRQPAIDIERGVGDVEGGIGIGERANPHLARHRASLACRSAAGPRQPQRPAIHGDRVGRRIGAERVGGAGEHERAGAELAELPGRGRDVARERHCGAGERNIDRTVRSAHRVAPVRRRGRSGIGEAPACKHKVRRVGRGRPDGARGAGIGHDRDRGRAPLEPRDARVAVDGVEREGPGSLLRQAARAVDGPGASEAVGLCFVGEGGRARKHRGVELHVGRAGGEVVEEGRIAVLKRGG